MVVLNGPMRLLNQRLINYFINLQVIYQPTKFKYKVAWPTVKAGHTPRL